MSDLVKLAKESIKYYLETGKYLTEYDEELKNNNNGVIVLSLIHISEPTRRLMASRMPSSA